MSLSLQSLRPCFEGAVPAVIATCARDGTPNVSYISEVHYVDAQHVALSYQFFSKTRQNVLENPRATVIVVHPDTGAQYRLAVRYLRTEESGPLFECMKAKLAGIASHAGMTGVFQLRGSDVYRVESAGQVYGTPLAAPPAPEVDVTTLRACMSRLSAAADLASLLDTLLDVLQDPIGIAHAMVLMHDPSGERLYTVASRGYEQSGVGAEVHPGEGIIGTAAQARIPIRISHATTEFGYGRAMREAAQRRGLTAGLEEEIPFPGLPGSQSQIAVPILAGERLLGVLFAESEATGRFGYDEEDGFMVLASHVGAVAALLEDEPPAPAGEQAPTTHAYAPAGGTALRATPLRPTWRRVARLPRRTSSSCRSSTRSRLPPAEVPRRQRRISSSTTGRRTWNRKRPRPVFSMRSAGQRSSRRRASRISRASRFSLRSGRRMAGSRRSSRLVWSTRPSSRWLRSSRQRIAPATPLMR